MRNSMEFEQQVRLDTINLAWGSRTGTKTKLVHICSQEYEEELELGAFRGNQGPEIGYEGILFLLCLA